MKTKRTFLCTLIFGLCAPILAAENPPATPLEIVLANTKTLARPRGERLPLYVWALTNIPFADDAEGERILKELDARGLALIAELSPGANERSLEYALRLGRLQQALGLHV